MQIFLRQEKFDTSILRIILADCFEEVVRVGLNIALQTNIDDLTEIVSEGFPVLNSIKDNSQDCCGVCSLMPFHSILEKPVLLSHNAGVPSSANQDWERSRKAVAKSYVCFYNKSFAEIFHYVILLRFCEYGTFVTTHCTDQKEFQAAFVSPLAVTPSFYYFIFFWLLRLASSKSDSSSQSATLGQHLILDG